MFRYSEPLRRLVCASVVFASIAFAPTLSTEAATTQRDVCSYVSDAQAAAALKSPAVHAALSDQTCVYATTSGSRKLSFVTIIGGDPDGSSPAALYTSWFQLAGDRAKPIAGVSRAFTVGSSVIALRNGNIVVISVNGLGEPQNALRAASMRLALPILRR